MVSALASASHGVGVPQAAGAGAGGSSVAALEGQLRQTQLQLNDWTTCVSAKTSKGQAAIQKLSGQIGADKEHIARALQTQSATSTSSPSASPTPAAAPGFAARAGTIDLWA